MLLFRKANLQLILEVITTNYCPFHQNKSLSILGQFNSERLLNNNESRTIVRLFYYNAKSSKAFITPSTCIFSFK